MTTKHSPKHSQVLIIGSGPAGYTAAIYAARANLKTTVVACLQPGGQLTITTEVENYPGFAEVIQGPWLMEQMQAQAAHVGAEIIYDIITRVDFSARPFQAWGDDGTHHTADAVIIATGAQARWLGIDSEKKFQGGGVSACATCDGFFYRGKRVAVIGGGNSAVEEALFLTNFATEVTVVHRRDSFRAEKILQDRLFKNPKVRVIWNHAVDEILGTENPNVVTGLRVKDIGTGIHQDLELEGVFIAIGHDPATQIFKGHVNMDESNYILTAPDSTATSIPGVFAAGDVKDKVYRQAITAAGMGCMAALEASKFIEGGHYTAISPW
jgi:thioredoxin reductase (NADPH)